MSSRKQTASLGGAWLVLFTTALLIVAQIACAVIISSTMPQWVKMATSAACRAFHQSDNGN